jgi:glucose-1-phosphate thymidylyltransferase
LDVQGRTVLDWLLSDVDCIEGIEKYVVVSNRKFFDHFTAWKERCALSHPVVVLDDGSTDNSNRLGAVKDILFAIEEQELDEDLLVLAGDNLLDFSLSGFVSFFTQIPDLIKPSVPATTIGTTYNLHNFHRNR